MSLLPSRPDAEPAADAGPRVIGVDSEDADEVLAALSSSTARSLLASLHEEPATPSELADRVDTSLQNVQYHLEKLAGAGAVEVVETAYSAKGREMDVYAPADQPLVIFAADQEKESTLRTALSRLLGGLGILAVASVVVQSIYGQTDLLPGLGTGGSGDRAPGGADGAAPAGNGDGGDGNGAGGDGGDDAGSMAEGDGAGQGATESPTPEAETPVPETGTQTTAEDAATPTPVEDTATEFAETATPTGTELSANVTTTARDALDATPTAEAADAVAGSGLPPGLLFFAGGAFVLAVLVVALYVRER